MVVLSKRKSMENCLSKCNDKPPLTSSKGGIRKNPVKATGVHRKHGYEIITQSSLMDADFLHTLFELS